MNILATCVGAYHDSGFGTGGLVLISGNKNYILDQNDSTGLFKFENKYFRFVRSDKALVVYTNHGIQKILFLREVQDAHDVFVNSNCIYCVSTMSNEVIVYNHDGKLIDTIKFYGNRDAWHLNCLAEKEGLLYVSAFGRFNEHREWNEKGCREKGFLTSLNGENDVISGLSGPHSPRYIDEKWMLCDSHKKTFSIFENNERKDIFLNGFTRGVTCDEKYIYVGVSSDRKSSNNGISQIVAINRYMYSVDFQIPVNMPEIYDIVLVDDSFVENVIKNKSLFEYNWSSSDQQNHLKNQTKLTELELLKLKNEFTILKNKTFNSTINGKGFVKTALSNMLRLLHLRK